MVGGRWERVRIEFEHKSSNFDHDPKGCDIIVCWEDNLSQKQKGEMDIIKNGIEIISLKDKIKELSNEPLPDPEIRSKQEFTLQDHFNISRASENIKQLFFKLDSEIKNINSEIWDKYSKTMITYYSPERIFFSVRLGKNSIKVETFTNKEKIDFFQINPS